VLVKVLLMAYECSPWRGSEWAVGWGRVLQAARFTEPHVITSEENFQALENARSQGLVPANVRFYTPAPDAKLRELQKKPALFAYNYRAYHHWQKLAFGLARELHDRENFDLVHQVNVCTFREPGYVWQLGVPFLWGPFGGSQNFPARFLTMLPLAEAFKEGMRSLSNRLSLRFKSRVQAAARAAAMIVAANSTNQRDYERAFHRHVDRLIETGLHNVSEPDRSRFHQRLTDPGAPLKILWSGEMQSRKALPILLRALAAIPDVPFSLTVLGDGPQRARWQSLTRRLGIAPRVTFLGRLPFVQAVAQMDHAELFCFPSLRDTSGNVVLEALAAGVPVLCFDHQGVGDIVTDDCGVKLPVISPARAVEDWARSIRELANDPARLLRMSEAATVRARDFLWDRNGDWMFAAYRKLAPAAVAEEPSVTA
jgi:glycosyltransferase involved in cell wall biosynthesis